MCLACSEDTSALPNDSTIEALRSKHPSPHPRSVIPTAPTAVESVLEVNHFILSGTVHADIRSSSFGSILLCFKKKDGGIPPIAIGCTLRRPVAKAASRSVSPCMEEVLAPLQLGYATSKGAEAAVHNARMYPRDLPANYAMVKPDFRNAFNSVRRDGVLEATLEHIP